MKSASRLLAQAYGFSFFWMFLVVIPVMVPFYQSMGLSMAQIFQIQALFGMAAVAGWAGVAVGLLFYLSRGVTQVLLREEYNARIPAEFRATANSLKTGCFRLVFAVFGPIIGYSIDHAGISATLNALGLAFLGLSFFLLPPLLREYAVQRKIAFKTTP